MSHEPPDPFADDLRAQLAYSQSKCAKALRELDEQRAAIAAADGVRFVLSCVQRDRDAAEAELAECRRLAFMSSRGATAEERQLAASVLVARLIRPPDAEKAAADALATFTTADNTNRETT